MHTSWVIPRLTVTVMANPTEGNSHWLLSSMSAVLSLCAAGVHIALYLRDHAGAMRRLAADELLFGNPRFTRLDRGLGLAQFRCKDIVDPEASWAGVQHLYVHALCCRGGGRGSASSAFPTTRTGTARRWHHGRSPSGCIRTPARRPGPAASSSSSSTSAARCSMRPPPSRTRSPTRCPRETGPCRSSSVRSRTSSSETSRGCAPSVPCGCSRGASSRRQRRSELRVLDARDTFAMVMPFAMVVRCGGGEEAPHRWTRHSQCRSADSARRSRPLEPESHAPRRRSRAADGTTPASHHQPAVRCTRRPDGGGSWPQSRRPQ